MMANKRTSTELYHKLKPFLRVAFLDIICYGHDANKAREFHREPFSIRYSHESERYWGQLRWDPKERSYSHKRPTYEQFCMWYMLRMEDPDA